MRLLHTIAAVIFTAAFILAGVGCLASALVLAFLACNLAGFYVLLSATVHKLKQRK